MKLQDALQDEGLVIGAVNQSSGDPVEVFRESDLPIPRTRYKLIIHQRRLAPIDLLYSTLDELINDLKNRRPDLVEDAWQRT